MYRIRGRLGLLPAALLLAGCAALDERASSLGDLAEPVELASTPFYPQERYQCGPASLATVLDASGVPVELESITELVYLPGRRGSLQAEILGAARANERLPYPVDGVLTALIAELEAGRPVLVLQNLGVGWYPVWHYAVVVGVDPGDETVVLRSGTEARRVTPLPAFVRTWARSDYWGIVLLRPGELPASPDRETYVAAVAALESTGHYDAALSAWKAAVNEWPDDRHALFGLANAAFAVGDVDDAEEYYRRLLAIAPRTHAARNNLAYVLVRQGQPEAALAEIEAILETVGDDDPFRVEYEQSWSEIAAMIPAKESIR